MTVFTQLALFGLAIWASRLLYRTFFARDALDNIPGPTSVSWLTGKMSPTVENDDLNHIVR